MPAGMANSAKNLKDREFGRLTVLRDSGRRVNAKIMWLCKCACGNLKEVRSSHLIGNKITSCGCFRDESAKTRAANGQGGAVQKTHGMSTSAIYAVYRTMVQRCHDSNADGYAKYGARGIYVCAEWRGDGGFERFLADMGEPPFVGATINRKDNDGPYAKDNCEWATMQEQGRNKQFNRKVIFEGEEWLLIELAEHLNIPYKVLHQRHVQRGWPLDRAVSQPLRGRA